MTEPHRQTVTVILQAMQLITLVVGVATIFMTVGRKDERLAQNTNEIAELRDIASDLVKTSIEATTTNRDQDRSLDDLRTRLARLENAR